MTSQVSPKRLVIATVPKSSIKSDAGVTTIRLPEMHGKSSRAKLSQGNSLKMPLPRRNPKPGEKRIFIHVAPDHIKEEPEEIVLDDEPTQRNGPARKRQRLDHLSFEQKLLRRKLKNRVAAQSARDKKKAKMDELEIIVKALERKQNDLADENKLLHRGMSELRKENEDLKAELQKRLSPECSSCKERRASSDLRVTPSDPSEPCIVRNKVVPTPIRSAESINVSQQREQAVRMALFLMMHGALWAWTVTGVLCLMPIAHHCSTNYKPSCSVHYASRLPMKKQFPDRWWGRPWSRMK